MEDTQQLVRHDPEKSDSDEHQAHSKGSGQADGLADAQPVLGAVVVGDDRNHGIVQTEDRHEDNAVDLEVDAEDGGSCRGLKVADQDHIHTEGHDGSDADHNNRRNGDLVDLSDQREIRPELPHIDMDFFIQAKIEGQRDAGCHTLSEDGSCCCSGDAHLRERSDSEDQKGIHDDVDDGADSLAGHGAECFSRGSEQSFQRDLHEDTEVEAAADSHVNDTAVVDGRIRCLNPYEVRRKGKHQYRNDKTADDTEENSVVSHVVGVFEFFFTQETGQEGVDTDAGSCCDGDHQVLNREDQRDGGQSPLIDLRYIHTVHNVVERLDDHRDDNGKCHGKQ